MQITKNAMKRPAKSLKDYEKEAQNILYWMKAYDIIKDNEYVGEIINTIINCELHFDESRGIKFSSYLCAAVRHRIHSILKKQESGGKYSVFTRDVNYQSITEYEDDLEYKENTFTFYNEYKSLPFHLLSDKERLVIRLYYFENKTQQQIAKIMKCSKQRVNQIKQRVLRILRSGTRVVPKIS